MLSFAILTFADVRPELQLRTGASVVLKVKSACDVDGNGVVNINDVTDLIYILFTM